MKLFWGLWDLLFPAAALFGCLYFWYRTDRKTVRAAEGMSPEQTKKHLKENRVFVLPKPFGLISRILLWLTLISIFCYGGLVFLGFMLVD